MDRELVLSVLTLLFGGLAAQAAGVWPAAGKGVPGGRERERRAWRRIWLPLAPAALVFAALAGWAWSEPADAEVLPVRLCFGALPFALVVLRAGLRAWRSCASSADLVAGTVGLLRPRVVISARLLEALDDPAREAALSHEAAHARHRDPLRLWLAQIASDLQWPWPAPRLRLSRWVEALELARDEEARQSGVAGEDLAAAVLKAAGLSRPESRVGAGMIAARAPLETRVRRLLEPLVPDTPRRRHAAVAALATSAGMAASVGSVFGEAFVRTLLTLPH